MKNLSQKSKSLLPLNPDVFTILLVLLDSDCHGFQIIKIARDRTGRRGQLQPGGLYRLLKKMLEAKLIEELESNEVPENTDKRRRYYRITSHGREVAAAEARRMADLVQISRRHDLLLNES